MPGVRIGWVVLHDRNNALKEIKKGITQMCGRNFGPCCTIQKALPEILNATPQKFFDETIQKVYLHAMTAYNLLKNIRGMQPIEPSGAFYMMIKIDLEKFPAFETDCEFIDGLTKEQSVKAFPGPCFDYPGYFRFVLTVPLDMLIEACQRIEEFCVKHYDANENEKTSATDKNVKHEHEIIQKMQKVDIRVL
jgi:tyrosine aminotransferase